MKYVRKREVKGFADPTTHDPMALSNIAWDERWKLNLEHRGLPPGELEANRTKGARRITRLVDYARNAGDSE